MCLIVFAAVDKVSGGGYIRADLGGVRAARIVSHARLNDGLHQIDKWTIRCSQ